MAIRTKTRSLEIRPSQVRYIKLGEAGRWDKECIAKGIVRFGFGSAKPTRFALSSAGKWSELTKDFMVSGRDKGTATRFTNETKQFFEDAGATLWITFVGERLYWGFLAVNPPEPHLDGEGVWRKVINGWRCTDVKGEELTKARLSGALTKLAAYRGTSCRVDVADYVIRRINGLKMPAVDLAIARIGDVRRSAQELMKLLGPKDFEILVDLVFSTSGWRRQGVVGKTQKTLDLDLILPSTGERAFVQIKSKTTSAELAEYAGKLQEIGTYDRMFFVFHSGDAAIDDERVCVIGPAKLAELVLNAGLVDWLIQKVS
jgi:hypothetical protein